MMKSDDDKIIPSSMHETLEEMEEINIEEFVKRMKDAPKGDQKIYVSMSMGTMGAPEPAMHQLTIMDELSKDMVIAVWNSISVALQTLGFEAIKTEANGQKVVIKQPLLN